MLGKWKKKCLSRFEKRDGLTEMLYEIVFVVGAGSDRLGSIAGCLFGAAPYTSGLLNLLILFTTLQIMIRLKRRLFKTRLSATRGTCIQIRLGYIKV